MSNFKCYTLRKVSEKYVLRGKRVFSKENETFWREALKEFEMRLAVRRMPAFFHMINGIAGLWLMHSFQTSEVP